MSINIKSKDQGIIYRNIKRPDTEDLDKLKICYTGLVLDILGKSTALDYNIKPINSGLKLCGPAITVKGNDLTLRRMAINLAQPGDVLVISSDLKCNTAMFGDGTALKMQLKGIEGIVIDGFTRDAAGIKSLNYPVFIRGISPRNFHYPIEQEYGSINTPIICGGQIIKPGDVLLGDDDGIVVIASEVVKEIASMANDIMKKEIDERKNLSSFESFDTVENELKNRGYKFIP